MRFVSVPEARCIDGSSVDCWAAWLENGLEKGLEKGLDKGMGSPDPPVTPTPGGGGGARRGTGAPAVVDGCDEGMSGGVLLKLLD